MPGIVTTLPARMEMYRRSPDFRPDNLPQKLQSAHSTKAGTWGLLRVLEGKLLFRLEGAVDGERLVSAGETVVIESEILHSVSFVEPGRFFIEFYRQVDGVFAESIDS